MADNSLDHQLMNAIAGREVDALRSLHELYAPIMIALARKVLTDRHDAEEVVNEVFWELWQKADRFVSERGAPRTYLLMLTRSRAIDRLRSRRSGVAGKTVASETFEAPATSPTPDHAAETSEMRRRVRDILTSLPEPQRLAVEQSFLEGRTHQQIAEDTKEPLGTIKGRIRQGLIRMRDELMSQEGGRAT